MPAAAVFARAHTITLADDPFLVTVTIALAVALSVALSVALAVAVTVTVPFAPSVAVALSVAVGEHLRLDGRPERRSQ